MEKDNGVAERGWKESEGEDLVRVAPVVVVVEMGGAEMAEGSVVRRQPAGRAGEERLVCGSGFGSQPQEGALVS